MTSHSIQIDQFPQQPIFYVIYVFIYCHISIGTCGLHLETLWNALTDFMLSHLGRLGQKGFALKTENSKDEGWYKNQWGFWKATRQKQHLSLQLNKSAPGVEEWHIVGALDSTESITGSIEQHDTIPWWKMGRGLGVALCRVFQTFTITQSKKIHKPWHIS